jgi:activator of HSP90 ATPase
MPRTIVQAVDLPAPPARLYAQYLDSRTHAAITGAPARLAARPGSAFSAFGGTLSGRILHLVPRRLIVQAWRSSHWRKSDVDSTLILSFYAEKGGARIELTHVDVPEHDFAGVSEGWGKYYWMPWRAYLSKR